MKWERKESLQKNKQLLQEIKQCIQEEKQQRKTELIKKEGKIRISGPKDRSASPMRNTAAHEENMPLNDYIKAISFQGLYKFSRNHRSTEFQRDHLRSSNPTPPAQAGSARAGCPVPGAVRLWISPLMDTLHPLWPACSTVRPPSEYKCSDEVSRVSIWAHCQVSSCLAFCAHCLTGHQSLDSSSSPLQRLLHMDKFSLSLLLSRLNSLTPLSLSSYKKSLTIFVGLHWTRSSKFVLYLYWRAQTQTQHSRCVSPV